MFLAVDINENGRRDYGEPVIHNSSERYDDFGSDGIPSDLEEGYDPITNPDPRVIITTHFTIRLVPKVIIGTTRGSRISIWALMA